MSKYFTLALLLLVCQLFLTSECAAQLPCPTGNCPTKSAEDTQLVELAPGTWLFSVNFGFKPVGLAFAVAQYDGFTTQSNGISIDYDYNGPGIDFSSSSLLNGISTSLFAGGEFKNGWDVIDLDDGIFSGIIYATATPTRALFSVMAEGFIPINPTPTPPEQIDNLLNSELMTSLPPNVQNQLVAKLIAALATLDSGEDNSAATATNQLQAFVNGVEADVQAGRLSCAEAIPLVNAVVDIVANLNQPPLSVSLPCP